MGKGICERENAWGAENGGKEEKSDRDENRVEQFLIKFEKDTKREWKQWVGRGGGGGDGGDWKDNNGASERGKSVSARGGKEEQKGRTYGREVNM